MSQHSSQSSTSESSDEDGWLNTNNPNDSDEEQLAIVSLVDERVFSDPAAMLAYCKEEHGLDFLSIRDRLDLDFYGCVKLINFIRKLVLEGRAVPATITASDIEDDAYLKPVLDDDALIFCLDSLPPPKAAQQSDRAVSAAGEAGSTSKTSATDGDLVKRNEELQSQLDQLTTQFQNYQLAVQQTLDQRWGVDEEPQTASRGAGQNDSTGKKTTNSNYYFESYAHNDIHETMLKDTVRTDAYRDFIYDNKHLFAGKTVLDIGCGTGILSMFCAKAGAKLVISVDRSDIIDKARENIFNNGLDDKIKCLKGLIEEVHLPVDKVDIIVSEWMGYGLLYEAMLPSVIYARDKYLKPDGLLVPSHASLWIAPVSDSEYICDSITFWRDVYGFDMKAMQSGIYDDARVLIMPASTVCGSSSMFRCFNLHTTTVSDLVFKADWKTTLEKSAESLDGFVIWFDIFFGTTGREEWDGAAEGHAKYVTFSTGPFAKETHWKQCFLLNKTHSKQLAPSESRDLSGEISFAIPSDNARALDLLLEWHSPDQEKVQKQSWTLK